ncbi:MAG: ATP-binding protein [Fibrobacter sp.]|nr:ATP-binding protein [Fibrobacter sp.]
MKKQLKLEKNDPTADVLTKSIRCMGYSMEAAIADIIDNSISAKANEIEIKFPVDPNEIYIAICDNGCGMSKSELFDAMKYGSALKGDVRDEDDLGRFGMGLKSASHSQCRRLSVISKKEGKVSAYIWDLDVVEEKKGWLIIDCDDEQISEIPCVEYLDKKKSGTVVVWQDFDFIRKESGEEYGEIVRRQDDVGNYLSLIFHRFLRREKKSRVSIKLNNFSLEPLDPFLENHPKSTKRKSSSIPVKDANGVERMIFIQPYVLPFQKDLSKEDEKLSGGIENYRTKQGFYIYRNERLIIYGTWFNRRRDELTKYARIQVDIPNTLDDVWGIDIKKQNAKIPASIRQRLTRAVDDVMDASVKRQNYRGRIAKVDEDLDYVWNRTENRGQYSYSINRQSRIFELLENHIDDEARSYLDMVLDEIEKNVPFHQIYLDKSKNAVNEEDDEERIAEILNKAKMMVNFAMSLNSKQTKEAAVEELFKSEPYCKHLELKEKVLEVC